MAATLQNSPRVAVPAAAAARDWAAPSHRQRQFRHTLNSVSVLHNTVIGGLGGTNSQFGGTLNNAAAPNGVASATDFPNVAADANPHNLMGANGIMFPNANTDPFIFGDGHGNGVVG